MQLNEYQRKAYATNEQHRLAVHVYGLVGEVGSVLATFRKRFENRGKYPGFRAELTEELGDTLWYLSNVAKLNGVTLEEVANKNIEKAEKRSKKGERTKFDKPYSIDERLPRKFIVEFNEKRIGRSVQVKLKINEVTVGDTLTDNSYDRDGYRFHDVFHLSFAAHFGWSPVVRSVLKRKRKSDRKKDEIEDGARAQIIEEAISLYVFNHAKQHNYYAGISSVEFRILRAVQEMVNGLEVAQCTAKQWQSAILNGYEAFRLLKKNRGGIVEVDLDRQRIEYRET